MTRNCLNVMRKIAADTKAAPYRIVEPMPRGGAVRQFMDLMGMTIGSNPVSPERRAALNTVFNKPIYKGAESLGIPTGMTPVERSYRLAAPTGKELYDAQKQVDARRAKSGLPAVQNQHNGPWADLKYNPDMRLQALSNLIGGRNRNN